MRRLPYPCSLRALSAWDTRFHGFGHDPDRVDQGDGAHFVQRLPGSSSAARHGPISG
jgi:hypothetical protein